MSTRAAVGRRRNGTPRERGARDRLSETGVADRGQDPADPDLRALQTDGSGESGATLDPQVAALLELVKIARPRDPRDIAATRALDAQVAEIAQAVAEPTPVEERIEIPGPAGPLPARVFWPTERRDVALPVALYFHGGGFVMNSADTHVHVTRELARRCESVVVSVDYRLSPEHVFPAAISDCTAATRWVRDHAASLCADPSRVVVMGDSAGGNAAAVAALTLRDDGDEPPLAGMVLICPWLDLSCSSPSYQRYTATDPVMDDVVVRYLRDLYLDGRSVTDPRVSPLFADLRGLPPTRIVLGGVDPLLDDGLRFAEKLEQSGVRAEVGVHAAMPHDFVCIPFIDAAAQALREIGDFVVALTRGDGARVRRTLRAHA